MKAALEKEETFETDHPFEEIDLQKPWKRIAPFWSLQSLIAINPLQGFEDLPFEEALKQGAQYFQQKDLPEEMLEVNRQTIKWLQAYYDEGQATLPMPGRQKGLYEAWKALAPYDGVLQEALTPNPLPQDPKSAITLCLKKLEINPEEAEEFLLLLLTTLPGWAAFIKHREGVSGTLDDYVAVRLALTLLLWPQAKELLDWHRSKDSLKGAYFMEDLHQREVSYKAWLLEKLTTAQQQRPSKELKGQWIFCIDVRSEPFRRALEAQGGHETFGFAGFFGIPISLSNPVTEKCHAICPALLSPKHSVHQCVTDQEKKNVESFQRKIERKKVFQSLKYGCVTPFALAELLGPFSLVWMALKSFFPKLFGKLNKKVPPLHPLIDSIPFEDQCTYAEGALRAIGLTRHFAPRVFLCGHGSRTENNAYQSALDCGACGGHAGGESARVMVQILSSPSVRQVLLSKGIEIPETTTFVAAEHNTTTDEVTLFGESDPQLTIIKEDLKKAQHKSNQERMKAFAFEGKNPDVPKKRAEDWAQIRPEWGLARNASFIVGPRETTASVDLEGRSFLHSYDQRADPEGAILRVIMTAPMIVAQWINAQYFFSSYDPIAFGGGSKVTKNVTGKIGVMQGNASDLMHGLPLQSVNSSDQERYHEPLRLLCVIYAPLQRVKTLIEEEAKVKELTANRWISIVCIDPETGTHFL